MSGTDNGPMREGTTLLAGRIVTATGVHAPGWIRIADGRIMAVGGGTPVDDAVSPRDAVRDLGADAIVVPGFVDLHAHGGGGGSYDGGTSEALSASRAHLAHGTTSTMASLVTASPSDLLERVARVAALILGDGGGGGDNGGGGDGGAGDGGDGGGDHPRSSSSIGGAGASTIRGIHLEGPWLSPARAGAHAPELLRHPDPAEIDALLEAGRGTVRMVTIAPELPGALDAIRRFADAGVVVAVGHTDAGYETTRRAIDAGARVGTHLFNAMRGLDHREPGPVLALVEDERVSVELIADGVHLHPSLVAAVRRAVGIDRVLLVTDAMSAAAMNAAAMDASGPSDGEYRLGGLDVEVRGGVARLAGTDTIAGSTATMDAMFRAAAGAGADAELSAAVLQTSANPARVAGWRDVGDLAPGKRADLVVLDPSLEVREVLSSGLRSA